MEAKLNPSLVVVAGPNGSGKSTFAQAYQVEHGGTYLSADLIAEEMRASVSAPSDIDAGRKFFARLSELLAHGEKLIVESTLSGRGISKHIDSARERGYDTSIAFIFLESADVCVARVAERARKGGHLVPEEDIRRRYPRSLKHFWDIHRYCVHRWHLFYNSGSQFAAVAAGVEADVSVVDESLYESFLHEVEGAKS